MAKDELYHLRYLNSKALRSDPRNRTVPITELRTPQEDRVYFEMPLLRSLVDLGRIDANCALGLALQLVQGVAFLHEHGIAHCDLKPSNIATREQTLYILDFGLARMIKANEDSARGLRGTRDWVAPEIIEGNGSYSLIRADAWAVGKLIHLVSGNPHNQFDRLRQIGQRLMAVAPTDRPSLSEVERILKSDLDPSSVE